jgi:4-amino-4-deoxy-L-arabinose transferase-like glycosyltransferase
VETQSLGVDNEIWGQDLRDEYRRLFAKKPRAPHTTLLIIFAAALGIRWIYDVALYNTMGDAGLMGVDSVGYLGYAQQFADHLSTGQIEGWNWMGPSPVMMPLFTWILTLHILVFGSASVLSYVLVQGLFDVGTCLWVYGIASKVYPRAAIPATIAAAINPTQIVFSGQLYPDTIFTFFVAMALFSAIRWWQAPTWGSVVAIIVAVALAAWTRVLIAPFVPALAIFLTLAVMLTRSRNWRHVGQIGVVLLCFAVCLAPVLLSNAMRYGSWSLTSQGGMHLARWIVPLIWEARDGRPWAEGYAEMERRAEERRHASIENPFEHSHRLTEVALEELRQIGLGPIVKAWTFGAIINIGTPAIILSPPVAALPRTGFYATPGTGPMEKISNFLFGSDNITYAWLLLSGVAGVVIVRFIQLGGFVALLIEGQWIPGLLFAGWCTFILCINGPIASPKYRLPLEPVLNVLTGIGWVQGARRRDRT